MQNFEERLAKVIAQGLGLVELSATGSDVDQRLALDPALADLRRHADVAARSGLDLPRTGDELKALDQYRVGNQAETLRQLETVACHLRHLYREAEIAKLKAVKKPDLVGLGFSADERTVIEDMGSTPNSNNPKAFRTLSAALSQEAVTFALKGIRAWHAAQAEIEKLKQLNAEDLTPDERDDVERMAAFERAVEHVAETKAQLKKRAEIQRAQGTLDQAKQAALGRR